MNYSRTNNCYSYVKLIFKKVNLKKSSMKIFFAHAQSIHVEIEFTRRNRFNLRIAIALLARSLVIIQAS